MTRHQKMGRTHAGFTLLEVLIAILVASVGLLGLAKMQALAVSGTQVASSKSLVAMQTAGLAAAMHGNRAFWGSGLAPASFSVSGTTVTDSSNVLNAPPATCAATTKPSSALCTPAQLAAYDVALWANNMNTLFPTYSTSATCTTAVTSPISCIVTVTWMENYVAPNQAGQASSAATAGTRSYTLYVEP